MHMRLHPTRGAGRGHLQPEARPGLFHLLEARCQAGEGRCNDDFPGHVLISLQHGCECLGIVTCLHKLEPRHASKCRLDVMG